MFRPQRLHPPHVPVRVGRYRGRGAPPQRVGPGRAPTTAHRPDRASDPDLRALLRQIDPAGSGHDPAADLRHQAHRVQPDRPRARHRRGHRLGDQQMQSFAAASDGRMTVQQQTFVQPVSSRIPVPTTITNVIATLQGTASPERFYVVTGHLDSRCTDVLDFTSDAPGADDDGSGVAVVLELARRVRHPPVPRHPGVRHRRRRGAGPVRLGLHGHADERRPATTSRGCSATTSSARAGRSTAPSRTRSRAAVHRGRPDQRDRRAASRSCRRSAARTTARRASSAGSSRTWRRSS